MSEWRALEAETEGLIHLTTCLGTEAWRRPTRCPPLDVRQLLAHVLSSYVTLDRVAREGSIDGEPEQDHITWWRYDPDNIGPWVVQRALEHERLLRGEEPARDFSSCARRAIAATAKRLSEEDPVCRPYFATVRLSEFVLTRACEVCIHAMDLGDALGLGPDPAPEALAVTVETLRALLGSDQPSSMEDTRFVIVATGREPLSEAERASLGPLAERLPLLS